MSKEDFRYDKILASIKEKNLDLTQKTIPFHGGSLTIIFVKQLTDTDQLSEQVIRPLMHYSASLFKPLDAEAAMNRVLYAADCKIEEAEDKIVDHILTGMVVMLFSNDPKYLVLNFKKVERRSTPTPEIQYVIRGPKDCFAENLDANLSLLRNRIKDVNLRVKTFEVGIRTKSRVAVIYIADIANDTVVTELEKRIKSIEVDGIYESGELEAFLLNSKYNLFPQMGLVERSDMASRMLLDGRVLTLIDGSGLGIYAPIAFFEFFNSCDDYYDNKYFGLFMKIIRYVALFTAFTISSLYIAVSSFHTNVLPSPYAILLAEMNAQAPFTALSGVLLLEFLMELIREALLRVPKQIGTAIGIVSAIVIGQAAISAGIFSPLLLIVASVSMLSSFTISDYTLMNAFRILKFVLIICTGIFGFYGFSLFLCVVLINLVSINSFGVPYMAPAAPFNLYDFLRSFMGNKTISPDRTKFVRSKDKRRM